MNNESQKLATRPTKEGQIVEAAAKLGESKISYLVGSSLLIVSMVALLLAYKWDGHMYDRRGCVNIKEIKGRFIKLDTCEGQWEEIVITTN